MNGFTGKDADSAGSSGDDFGAMPLPPSHSHPQGLTRQLSTTSYCESEDDESKQDGDFVPGALIPLKQQLELDKVRLTLNHGWIGLHVSAVVFGYCFGVRCIYGIWH